MVAGDGAPVLHASLGSETFRIPFSPGPSLWALLEAAGVPIRSGCRGGGACGLCRVRVLSGAVEPPRAGERDRLSADRLAAGERLACRLTPRHDLRVAVLDRPEAPGWTALADTGDLTAASAGAGAGGGTGVAVDLGTTHIRLAWWDLANRRLLASRVGRNPQARFGADLLSRLAAAAAGYGGEIARLARDAIGEAVRDMAGDEAGGIARVTIVGNTAMLALLTGGAGETLLGPDGWARALECRPKDADSWRRSWRLAGDARVDIVQPLAGFVGSDLLAGLLACRLCEGPPGSLFVDFGTNTEIALWDGGKLWVTSAAGGPAFEGSGISCGWPAEAGAVFRVEVGADAGVPVTVGVIGGGEARGLCGSGVLDTVAGLRRAGLLSPAGRFAAPVGGDGFAVAPGIILRKRDVDIFQRAKAAVAAAVACLVELAGLTPPGLERLCIGGAFGRTLRLDAAFETGLLPRVPPDRIELFGQAALAGCGRLMFASDPDAERAALACRADVTNMATVPRFEDRFVAELRLQPFLLK